jgi:Phosphoserine phosphatase
LNVYDFDNTILRGDSTARFFAYCLRHFPRMWADVPAQAVNGLLFVLKIRKKQVFKQRMLGFLKCIPDVDAAVDAFWAKNFDRVKPFYADTHRADDVIISASPEFLIRPACERLNIKTVMGSPVDKHTGTFSGLNCHGEEKVRRFRAVFPDAQIDDFYSDSLSDSPLADCAERAYMVTGEKSAPGRKGGQA